MGFSKFGIEAASTHIAVGQNGKVITLYIHKCINQITPAIFIHHLGPALDPIFIQSPSTIDKHEEYIIQHILKSRDRGTLVGEILGKDVGTRVTE